MAPSASVRPTPRFSNAEMASAVAPLPLAGWVGNAADCSGAEAAMLPILSRNSFTIRAAAWYGASEIACPPQYLPGKEQIFRNSVRDRQDFDDLKIKGKPKTRAELKAEATKPLAAE